MSMRFSRRIYQLAFVAITCCVGLACAEDPAAIQKDFELYEERMRRWEWDPEKDTHCLPLGLHRQFQDIVRYRSEEAVKRVLSWVDHSDPRYRFAAYYTLGQLSRFNRHRALIPPIVPKLKQRLSRLEKNDKAAYPILNALREIGPEAAPATWEILVRTSGSKNRPTSALERIGVRGLPICLDRLTSLDPEERRIAMCAIASLGKEAKPATEQILQHLQDDDWQVRQAAVWACNAVTPDPSRASPPLTALVRNLEENDEVRTSAIMAIAKIGDPESVAVLIELLDPNQPGKMAWAVPLSLRAFPSEKAKIIPLLIPLLDHHDASVIGCAAQSLGSFGADAKEATPKLASLIRSPKENVSNRVLAALTAIGPEARSAIPVLIQAIHYDSRFLCRLLNRKHENKRRRT